jgi:hypothetical protein
MSVTLSDFGSTSTVNQQNLQIMALLEKMFVVTPDPTTSDIGVPYGSEARVLCRTTNNSYQVRRFKIASPFGTPSWQPYNIVYPGGTTATNIVP